MSTPILNNGLFLRDTNYQASSHLDSYHLQNMLHDAQPMDMGPVELWAMTQKNDLPFIVEDINPSNTTKGADGTTFEIKISRREFGLGDIITYDKYTGVEMYINPQYQIVQAGDAFIYTVQLVNNDSIRYIDNKYLANGTPLFRVCSPAVSTEKTLAAVNHAATFDIATPKGQEEIVRQYL